MVDLTTEFFERIARVPQPVLAGTTATIRLDLEDGKSVEHWFVEIQRGLVSASRRKTKADSVLRLDRALFEKIITGRANSMASLLRGLVTMEGNRTDIVALQRIFPGPPRKPPPARIPSSAVRGPTSAVAQKPPKTAPKRAVAATKAAVKKPVTAKTTRSAAPKTATKARAKRSAS